MRLIVASLISLLSLAPASPAPAQIVINEVLPDPGSMFDGSEYIELHNPTGSAIDITGWVLATPEFDGSCGGDHLYAFPVVTTIQAGGYLVIAKDNLDVPGPDDDSFRKHFGFDADLEFFDPDRVYEFDDPSVPNMTLITANAPGFDTQIRLVPGSGYGASCNMQYNRAEVVYLWDGDPRAAGTLVDAIEFGDELACSFDPCPGVGTSDSDAFLVDLDASVLEGVSIGRDATGTDTGNSAADLALGTPTPKAANIPNPGPTLSDLRASPPGPSNGQPCEITIAASDPDGIASLFVVFDVNGGAPDSVSMVPSGPDRYRGTIPGQTSDDLVSYFVRATDLGSPAGTSAFPDYTARTMRWGTQSIFATQFHSPPSDTGRSFEFGNPVNIEGIVTTEPGLYNEGLITVQSGSGHWSGVHCFDPTFAVTVGRGDSVRISGTVLEYFGRTEVEFFGNADVQILSSGNPLPSPSTISASTLTSGNILAEVFEGVYVRIPNVVVTNPSTGFGQWEIGDATGTCLVGDDAYYYYHPPVPAFGDSLVAVQGIADYSYGERKIEPRDDGDVIGPPIIATLRYAPICPLAQSAVTISATITDNGSLTRAKLFFAVDGGAQDSVDLANSSGDTWEATIGPFPNGATVDYHVEVTDDSGFDGRRPTMGSYGLHVGLTPIETIQSLYASGTTDSSAAAGQPRNVAGLVTVAPGVLADNLFTIQNTWTVSPANRAIEIYTGGNVVGLVAEGDSVCVCGDVVEFFGKTQIDTHWSTSFINHGHVGAIQAFPLTTTEVPPDSAGPVPTAEPWESVLVHLSGSVVTNAAAGFGQYYVDNTDPRTAEEALIDDEARFSGLSYLPSLGDSISIRGTVDFAFGQYKLQPRRDSDILPYDPVGATERSTAQLQFRLHQNAPNPIQNSVTHIGFAVAQTTHATLRIYDVTGRLVTTLLDAVIDAGPHRLHWDGRDDEHHAVSSGVYFYRLQAEGKEATRKMVLVR